MARLNIQPNLFLGSIELTKMQSFLDQESFRSFLLSEIKTPGFIKKSPNDNVITSYDSSSFVLNTNLTIIDSLARIVKIDTKLANQSVPNDNTWKWLKITYAERTKEKGFVSVTAQGVLTGVNTEFLSLLRGQPNFPTKIKLLGSLNTGEYEVVSVDSNTQAVLLGSFQEESAIEYEVVGTFTPGFVPDSNQKFPFRYDGCTLTYVNESVENTPPAKSSNEFYLLRLKRNGDGLIIQDKRTEYFETQTDFENKSKELTQNPVFSIESIQYKTYGETNKGTYLENTVQIGWGFRSNNFTYNPTVSIITINGGEGGRFKSTSDFTDGDFNNWKVYFRNGKYATILTSSKSGSQINIVLDSLLDSDILSSDDDLTQGIVVVPDSGFIEIRVIPDGDSWSREQERHYSFPSSLGFAKIDVPVYEVGANEGSVYNISYRNKTNKNNSPWLKPLADSIGYFTEASFDDFGYLKPEGDRVRQVTSVADFGTNFIVRANPNNYAIFNNKIEAFNTNYNLGEVGGVSAFVIDNTVVNRDVVVGQAKKICRFTRASGGLQALLISDIFINLPLTDINGNAVKQGTSFRFILKDIQSYDGSFKIRIVQNYTTVPSLAYDLVKELTEQEVIYANRTETDGLAIDVYLDNTGNWRAKVINDVLLTPWTDIPITNADYNNAGASWFTLQCQRNFKDNIVRLSGAIKNFVGSGSGITTVAVLPSSFRPVLKVSGVAVQEADTASTLLPCIIETNGEIKIVGAHGLNNPIDFSSITFRVN